MKLTITLLLVLIANVLLGQNYHDTQGKLEISNSGQATYTLPIALPPSIQSVGPTINLNYTSGQQGGIAGQGWNISGVSTITRMATRKDIDGFIDGVDKDADDKLALDGQRLLLKSGTYLSPGSIYETEVQSNLKIQMLTTSTATSYEFVVTSPDGSKSWYSGKTGCDLCCFSCGTSLIKHINMTFYIYKYEDVNGNQIEYKYAPDGYYSYWSPQYIKEIWFSYNSNSNQTYTNKILFKHKPASRQEKSYILGSPWEKKSILDYIEVYTNMPNDLLFKKYQLNYYLPDDLGYDRLKSIQESNGIGELANPVEFQYDLTSNGMTIYPSPSYAFGDYINMDNGIRFSGDFNGDNILDIVYDNVMYYKQGSTTNYIQRTLPFTVSSRKTMTGSVLYNNKMIQHQSLINVSEWMSLLAFDTYSILPNTSTFVTTTKTLAFNNPAPIYDSSLNTIVTQSQSQSGTNVSCQAPTGLQSSSNEYLEGDFNGDGISEILIYKKINEKYYFQTTNKHTPLGISYSVCETKYKDDGTECFLVDTNPSSSSTLGQQGYLSLANSTLLVGDKKFVNDYNGDGKADVLIINNNGAFKVVGFKQLKIAPWVVLEQLGQGTIDRYSTNKQILFGDYNGDSKIDIMLPDATGDGCINCATWYIYYGNDGYFRPSETHSITEYLPKFTYPNDSQIFTNNYYAIDINKDGKTDLVRFEFWIDNNSNYKSWKVHTFLSNKGDQNKTVTFINNFNSEFKNESSYVIPFFGSQKVGKASYDLMIFGFRPWGNGMPDGFFYKWCNYYTFDRNTLRDNSIIKVTQAGGAIVDEITYSPLISSDSNQGYGLPTDFYSSNNTLNYPFMMLRNIPSFRIVSQLKTTAPGVVGYQDFKYFGFTASLDGLGAVGFNKTARSSRYRTNSDKKTWTVTESDPLIRGAIKRNYSQLLDGSVNFAFSSSTVINPTTTIGLINKTENNYFSAITDATSKKYTLLLSDKTTTDYLTNVSNQVAYTYTTDGYNLPYTITSKNYLSNVLQSTTTSKNTYANLACTTCTGSGYYIGRPTNIITTVDAYAGQYSTSETLTYTNGNVTLKEKKVGTTEASLATAVETLVETMNYFPNGNLASKTLSATGFPVTTPPLSNRTVSYTYDTSNRYVKTTTDAEGLVTTNNVYDDRYGLVKSVTKNTFGQTTLMDYDNWGKQIKVTDYLGKSINYTYSRYGNVYVSSSIGDDYSRTWVETDVLGRVTRKLYNYNNTAGNESYVDTQYDWLGRKYKESEPYYLNINQPQWNYFVYDDYNRLITNTLYTGKVINVGYLGLTATTNDGVMEKTTTKNANGHLITTTENFNGSIQTITYTYDAAGNLIKTLTGGNETAMTYDLWGRKTSLQDKACHDSAYTYTYNAYGEVLKETTPKGFTDYTYTPTGKILTKWIKDATTPLNTNIKSTYTYDTTYKWLKQIDVVNSFDGNSTFQYFYDVAAPVPTMQLKKTIETNSLANGTNAVFTTDLIFDSFGRTLNETLTATAHGKTATKTVTNTYRYGQHYQTFDGLAATGTPLWQMNDENERGNLVNASLGNGLNIYNTYDSYGFPKQIKYGTSFLTLDTTFDRLRGNLTNRQNSMFGTNENFEYDNYDRLISWDGNGPNLLNLTFAAGIEGFIFVGAAGTGQYQNYLGGLKSTLLNSVSYMKKTLPFNLTTGNKLKISADVSGKTGSTGVIVNAIMVETNPNNVANTNEVLLGTLENGIFNANYTVSNFVANPQLSLKFIIKANTTGAAQNVTFIIDNIKIDNISKITQNYDVQGKITENNIGKYVYNTVRPYRNEKINYLTPEASTYYTNRNQIVTYNAFNAPVKITQNSSIEEIDFGYNMMEQRNIMYYGSSNSDKLLRPYRKYYDASGRMEIKASYVYTSSTTPSLVEFLFYIGGDAYSAPIVTRQIDNTTPSNFYLHRDYQGSIVAISIETGALAEKRMFDPWGEVIKVQDWAGNTLSQLTFLDRGYTGHEHLQGVGLINMNARLYDPKLHRFLQPDQMLQDPQNSQNYNRYAYCYNNPLKYKDPSGNFIGIIIGVAVAVGSYLYATHQSNRPVTYNGVFMAVFWGFMSSTISFGVGEATSTISTFAVRAAVQSVAHGATQGGLSAIQGGKFWNSFAAGSISSLAASGWSGGSNFDVNGNSIAGTGFGGIGGSSGVSMIAFGTVMGGAGSALAGGNFWQGAVTGLFVSGLNHAMHKIEQRIDVCNRLKAAGYKSNQIINQTDEALSKFGQTVYPDMYEAGGNPEFLINDTIGDNTLGTTRMANGRGTQISVHIHTKAFTTNFDLAMVVGHELVHAIDYSHSEYWTIYKSHNEEYARQWTEANAYGWENTNHIGTEYFRYKDFCNYIGRTPNPENQFINCQN